VAIVVFVLLQAAAQVNSYFCFLFFLLVQGSSSSSSLFVADCTHILLRTPRCIGIICKGKLTVVLVLPWVIVIFLFLLSSAGCNLGAIWEWLIVTFVFTFHRLVVVFVFCLDIPGLGLQESLLCLHRLIVVFVFLWHILLLFLFYAAGHLTG